MRLPSLKFLKTFQVAAVRLSFKAAAEELCITASAVSHQIKTLEEQLGVLLFERGPHSLSLTEAGKSYLGHRPETDIHINTIAAPLQSHPAEADVSIVVDASPEEGLSCHKLFSQTFVPACAPSLLRRSPIASVADLNQHTLITHEARRDGWHRWAEALGIELRPKNLIRFDTMHTAAQAAEHGVGIALVSTRLGNERFAQGTLVKLFETELQTGESYFLILRPEDARRPDIQALTRWMLQEFSAAA